jgi:hypothetical protein
MENYRHPNLRRQDSHITLELDIFLPKEQLGFEYQGENHYRDIYSMGFLWQQRKRDQEKRDICKENGITLIEVPYWWDKQPSSLAATIRNQTERLITDCDGEPIPGQLQKSISSM